MMNDYLPIINMLGFLILGGSMVFAQWKLGGPKVASEVIDTYKVQVQQLREEIAAEKKGREDDRHNLKNEIQNLALQLEHMKGADTEKDKKIKEFTEIFQGKSPEQAQYMTDMRNFTRGVAEYMDKSTQAIGEIGISMHALNESNKEQSAIIHALYEQLVVKTKAIKRMSKNLQEGEGVNG